MSSTNAAVQLAESSDWNGLQRLIEKSPQYARECDDYGMLPIHWACTESNVPLDLLDRLIQSYPEGARVKNNGHLLPLHIAIRVKASMNWFHKLLHAYPEAVLVETPNGSTPLMLAKQVQLDPSIINLLQLYEAESLNSSDAEKEWERLSHDPSHRSFSSFSPKPSFDQKQHKKKNHLQRKFSHDVPLGATPTIAESIRDSRISIVSRHTSLPSIPVFDQQVEQVIAFDTDDDSSGGGEESNNENNNKITSGPEIIRKKDSIKQIAESNLFDQPPEWKRNDECSICHAQFGMFKHRHHCRNCGKSICRQHSADKKITMISKGYTSPQRACVTCYAILMHNRTKSVSSNQSDPESSTEDSTTTIRSLLSPRDQGSVLSTLNSHDRAETMVLQSQVNELKQMVSNLHRQIDSVSQANISMQQQLLEQEELKAETMLLITEVMTRVSVLELQHEKARESQGYDL